MLAVSYLPIGPSSDKYYFTQISGKQLQKGTSSGLLCVIQPDGTYSCYLIQGQQSNGNYIVITHVTQHNIQHLHQQYLAKKAIMAK